MGASSNDKELLASLAQLTQAANRIPDADTFGYTAALSPAWAEEVARASDGLRRLVEHVISAEEEEDDLELLFDQVQEYVEKLLEDVDGLISESKAPRAATISASISPEHRYARDALKGEEKPEIFEATASLRRREDQFMPRPWDGRVVGDAHPFDAELRNLEYSVNQLRVPQLTASDTPAHFNDADCEANDSDGWHWVETSEGVSQMGRSLAGATELAVDLEHHSWRSFHGMSCLIQISRRQPPVDFVVDVLRVEVRKALPAVLGPLLTDASIVKVMHGANSDARWLERDFGLYIVNLFDTALACDKLGYPHKSLSYLLEHHVGNTPIDSNTKRHLQRADWRQRPLPARMRAYARQDTHFLLFVYDKLRLELGPAGTRAVLDASKRVCRSRFNVARFDPGGWRAIISSVRASDALDIDEAVLNALWDWRDTTARANDESPGYVMANEKLFRMAAMRPTEQSAVELIGGFMSAHADKSIWAAQIADVIHRALMDASNHPAPVAEDDEPVFDVIAAPSIVVLSTPHRMNRILVAPLDRCEASVPDAASLQDAEPAPGTQREINPMQLPRRLGWFSASCDEAKLREIWGRSGMLEAALTNSPKALELPEAPVSAALRPQAPSEVIRDVQNLGNLNKRDRKDETDNGGDHDAPDSPLSAAPDTLDREPSISIAEEFANTNRRQKKRRKRGGR